MITPMMTTAHAWADHDDGAECARCGRVTAEPDQAEPCPAPPPVDREVAQARNAAAALYAAYDRPLTSFERMAVTSVLLAASVEVGENPELRQLRQTLRELSGVFGTTTQGQNR